MQKRKIIPLTTLLLCSLCFSACGGKPTITNVIARVNGVDITTEDVYNTSLYNKDVAEHVYGILEKALIKSSIPVNDNMRTEVENKVNNMVDKIKADAKLNNTDFKEDLKKALEEEKVSSVEELKEKKIYELQKEAAKAEFLKNNEEEYAKAYVTNNYLYHVGDIQLAVSSDSTNITDFYGLTISVDQAEEIHDTILDLIRGIKFYNVALRHSTSDTKDAAGEEGIVTLKDSDITNELRYALIGYSSIFEGKYEELKTNLNFPSNREFPDASFVGDLYNQNSDNFGIKSIPLSYIENLEDNYETSECYSNVKDRVYTTSKVYYRNILFNNLLNSRSPRFITLTEQQVEKYNAASRVKPVSELGVDVFLPTSETVGYKKASSEVANKTYVLTNDEGRPYMMFKDKDGLHITTIHMTPFDANYTRYFDSKPDEKDDYVSYSEYGKNIEDRKAQVKEFSNKYFNKDYSSQDDNEKLLGFEIFKYFEKKNTGFKIVDENIKTLLNQYMYSTGKLTERKGKIVNEKNFKDYATDLRTRNYIVINEVPLLSCLEKDKNGQRKCTYEYGKGFAYYDTDNKVEGSGK